MRKGYTYKSPSEVEHELRRNRIFWCRYKCM